MRLSRLIQSKVRVFIQPMVALDIIHISASEAAGLILNATTPGYKDVIVSVESQAWPRSRIRWLLFFTYRH